MKDHESKPFFKFTIPKIPQIPPNPQIHLLYNHFKSFNLSFEERKEEKKKKRKEENEVKSHMS